ncbi:MAG: hypothetical protein HY226_03855 [Candidatus Vogelbacteria bacterium]|nr:hypothetical protein [Candidatus Vogelbacteria bacterium]
MESAKQHEILSRREAGRSRFGDTWRDIRKESLDISAAEAEKIILPRVSIPADGDSIKNQEIDVINEGERIAIMFKLRKPKWHALAATLRANTDTKKSSIVYGGNQMAVSFCNALKLNLGDLRLIVAETEENGNDKRSSYGLVRVEIGKEPMVLEAGGVEKKITKSGEIKMLTLGNLKKQLDAVGIKFQGSDGSLYYTNKGFLLAGQKPDTFVVNKEVFNGTKLFKDDTSFPAYKSLSNGGFELLPADYLHANVDKILIPIYSNSHNAYTYYLYDCPEVEAYLDMLVGGAVATKEVVKGQDGKEFEVEKGVNYFVTDKGKLYQDESDGKLYKIYGYTNVGGNIEIVLEDTNDGTLRVANYKEFSKYSQIAEGMVLEKKGKPKDPLKDKTGDEIAAELEQILEGVIGIKDALAIPDEAAKNGYKLNRYRWSHKLPDSWQVDAEEEKSILSRLKQVEVAPGYQTFVEGGRAEKIKEKGPFYLYHSITAGQESLVRMVKVGALISTHQRFSRGVNVSGMSSSADIGTGGADGIFARMWSGPDSSLEQNSSRGAICLIFDSDILGRTDYYCYNSDKFGSTTPDNFNSRVTPEQLLEQQRVSGFKASNEIIFRHGVAVKDIRFIAVTSQDQKNALIKSFTDAKITEINGQSLDNYIKVCDAKPITILSELDPEIKKKIEIAKEKAKVEKLQKMKEKYVPGKEVSKVVVDAYGNITSFQKGKIQKFNDDLTVDILINGAVETGVSADVLMDGVETNFTAGSIVTLSPGHSLGCNTCDVGPTWKIYSLKVVDSGGGGKKIVAVVRQKGHENDGGYNHECDIDKLVLVPPVSGDTKGQEKKEGVDFKVGDQVILSSDYPMYGFPKGSKAKIVSGPSAYGDCKLEVTEGPSKGKQHLFSQNHFKKDLSATSTIETKETVGKFKVYDTVVGNSESSLHYGLTKEGVKCKIITIENNNILVIILSGQSGADQEFWVDSKYFDLVSIEEKKLNYDFKVGDIVSSTYNHTMWSIKIGEKAEIIKDLGNYGGIHNYIIKILEGAAKGVTAQYAKTNLNLIQSKEPEVVESIEGFKVGDTVVNKYAYPANKGKITEIVDKAKKTVKVEWLETGKSGVKGEINDYNINNLKLI